MTTFTSIEDHAITLDTGTHWRYPVDLDRIRRDGIQLWVEHLRRKQWFTPEHERQFTALWGTVGDRVSDTSNR